MADTTDHVIVRALFWAARVDGLEAPWDTLHLRIAYPARRTDTMEERMSGIVPAAAEQAPFGCVVLCPGINVSPDAYRWLADRLALAGYVVATYQLVGELFAGQYGITPGIDLGVITPDTYGSAPPLSTIPALRGALAELDAGPGPLAGLLDLDRIVLGGHSAGGTVVLESARRAYLPGLAAVFTYGAHTMAATTLGWDVGTVLPTGADVPVLMVGGSDDGVIGASAVRYGEEAATRDDPLWRTFHDAVPGGRDDSYLFVLDGANHFVAVDPHDPTSARGFLDGEPRRPEAESRARFASLVEDFLAAHVRGDVDAHDRLSALVAAPPDDLAVALRR